MEDTRKVGANGKEERERERDGLECSCDGWKRKNPFASLSLDQGESYGKENEVGWSWMKSGF